MHMLRVVTRNSLLSPAHNTVYDGFKRKRGIILEIAGTYLRKGFDIDG